MSSAALSQIDENVASSSAGSCIEGVVHENDDGEDEEDSYVHQRHHHHQQHPSQLPPPPSSSHLHHQQHSAHHDELCKQETYDLNESMLHTGLLNNTVTCLRGNDTEISSTAAGVGAEGDNLYCC